VILSLQAFAPAALLLAGGLVLLLRPSATVYVVVEAVALAGLLRLSQLATSAITVPVYEPLADAPLQLRVDRLSLFFATAAVAATLLISLPWLGDRERRLPFGWLALAQFGTISAILAGNLQGLAAGWGLAVAALLMLVVMPEPSARGLRRPSVAATRSLVLHLAGAAVLLAGAVAVEAIAGTASYDAVPIGAVDNRTGLLLAAAPILALATLAGTIRLCRSPATAALMVTGVTVPMSVYVLARSFDLAGGRPLAAAVASVVVAAAGLLAALFALFTLWAPDLGATVSRGLNALGLLLVVAFAAGGAIGLVALLVGFMSLQLVAGSTLALTDAGGGRLPGRGTLPRWAAGMVSLLPLLTLGGVVAGLALDARMLLLRRLIEAGPGALVLGIPAAGAVLALLAGAAAATRFGGGRLKSRRGAAQVLIAAAALLGAGLAAPALRDLAASLAAAAARVPVAEVRSGVAAAVPGQVLTVGLVLLLAAALAVAVARPRVYSAEDGLLGAPDLLPPSAAVIPEIVLSRAIRGTWQRGADVARGTGAGTRLALLAVTWAAAVAVVLLVGR
jgi:hypothetical protein